MCNNKCSCCSRFLKSDAVAVTGTAPSQVLTVTVPQKTLTNLESYCLIICQSVPAGLTIPVVIADGSRVLPILCKKGNTLRADQIRGRKRYSVTYGNDPAHLILSDCMPQTGYAV